MKTGRGKHRKYAPYVFTDQGIAMLSSVLSSERAVHVNIEIMRHKLVALENKYDPQFKVVFDAIRSLMEEPDEMLAQRVRRQQSSRRVVLGCLP